MVSKNKSSLQKIMLGLTIMMCFSIIFMDTAQGEIIEEAKSTGYSAPAYINFLISHNTSYPAVMSSDNFIITSGHNLSLTTGQIKMNGDTVIDSLRNWQGAVITADKGGTGININDCQDGETLVKKTGEDIWECQDIASTINGSKWEETGDDIYRSTGNVGIGTNNPQANFHVRSANATSSSNLWVSDGSNRRIVIQSPTRLDVATPIPGRIFTSTNSLILSSEGAHNHVVINETGNVGVGNMPVSGKLYVHGDLVLREGVGLDRGIRVQGDGPVILRGGINVLGADANISGRVRATQGFCIGSDCITEWAAESITSKKLCFVTLATRTEANSNIRNFLSLGGVTFDAPADWSGNDCKDYAIELTGGGIQESKGSYAMGCLFNDGSESRTSFIRFQEGPSNPSPDCGWSTASCLGTNYIVYGSCSMNSATYTANNDLCAAKTYDECVAAPFCVGCDEGGYLNTAWCSDANSELDCLTRADPGEGASQPVCNAEYNTLACAQHLTEVSCNSISGVAEYCGSCPQTVDCNWG
ncbi:MAG: hypothetical protein ACLFN8_00615 [Candidatus Woesearchaeota archaeon]